MENITLTFFTILSFPFLDQGVLNSLSMTLMKYYYGTESLRLPGTNGCAFVSSFGSRGGGGTAIYSSEQIVRENLDVTGNYFSFPYAFAQKEIGTH